MNQRAEYLIQVFEQIGSPLMRSILRTSEQDDPTQDAQKMAELLGKSVALSISMANMAELSSEGSDAVRVALAALACPLIGEMYNQNKQTPTDNDLNRITSALQAVLTFSENFTPEDDNTKRLKNLEARGVGSDAHQMSIQYMQAFVPAVSVIGAFSFGQPEQKLIMEVSARVTVKASNIRKAILGDVAEDEEKIIDLAILKSLVEIYAECHNTQTQRLSAMNEQDQAADSQGTQSALKTVWETFDTRAAMLETLAKSLLPSGAGAGENNGSIAPKTAIEEAPVTSAPEASATAPPVETAPSAPAQPAENEDKPAPAGNPMSMFAKPKNMEDAEVPTEAPSAPPPTAATETPAPAPEDAPAKSATGGGPMSFFKKPEEDSDE